jgi:endoglucanase
MKRILFSCFCISLIMLVLPAIHAQNGGKGDLLEILPVTDKILALHFRDGHIDTYGTWETVDDNVLYLDTLNLDEAERKENYILLGVDDLNYSAGKLPVHIGRKSKGLEYQGGNMNPPFIMQHWIYIELPHALQQGKTYTLQLQNLGGNRNSYSFTYDVYKTRSETVHVNMVGFPVQGPKIAYLSHWMGDFDTPVHRNGGLNLDDKGGTEFRIIEFSSGKTAYKGNIYKRMSKTDRETDNADFPGGNYTNADVWECDFSSFKTPGEYVVAVDGIGCSFPFEIGDNVTREPFYYAMKGLFWQRQGIVKEIEPDSVYPRAHHPDDITWRYDKNWIVDTGYDESGFNKESPQIKGIWGHYYDAGDWDGYTHHNRVPAHLLLLYDLAPGQFYDGEANNRYKLHQNDEWIIESRNGKPDLLDEASWLIEFHRRARHVIMKQGGTGGVPGYVGRDAIPHSNRLPAWEDTREWYLSGENPLATFWYAGLAAYYAINLNQFQKAQVGPGNHPEYSKWLQEAVEAWAWAGSRNLDTAEGRRVKGFAAACLYRATGEEIYQSVFEDYWKWEPNKSHDEVAGVNIWDISAALFALIPSDQKGLNTALQSECRNHIIDRADSRAAEVHSKGFRNGMTRSQFLQLGAFTTARTTTLAVAHRLTGDDDYLSTMQHIVNYVLGGNQLNLTYLSGLGERSDHWIFQPSAYLVSNKNSKVYTPENYPGQTSYFGGTGLSSEYWHKTGTWKWSEYFSRMASWPQAAEPPSTWPGAEQKFQNRYSIQGAEFTIHQQMNHMIFSMGYIKAMNSKNREEYNPAPRPLIKLNLCEGEPFAKSGCWLSVDASENTRLVEYFYEWRKIGESTDVVNNFRLYWKPPQSDGVKVLVTAVAYSDRGRKSLPSAEGDKLIIVSADAECAGEYKK